MDFVFLFRILNAELEKILNNDLFGKRIICKKNIYDLVIDSRKLKYTYPSQRKASMRVKSAAKVLGSQRDATLALRSVREGSLIQLIIS